MGSGAVQSQDALGWVSDERGVLRRETIHRMGRRLPDFAYDQRRIYEITIVLDERRPILGQLLKQGAEWLVEPSELGEIVLKCWNQIPGFWPQVELIEACLMPDHFHGILFVKEQLPKGKALGNVIGSFKSRSSSEVKKYLAARGEEHNLAAGGSCQGSARGGVPPRFWAEGYVDVILFRKGQLEKMITYLRDNPRRLGIKQENRDLFKVSRDLEIPDVGHFAAIGNHFLLSRPELLQVQVSRSDFAYRRERLSSGAWRILRDTNGIPLVEKTTPQFEAKAASLLAAAKNGAVLVSPAISHGEREIARRAFVAGYRVIALQNKGFSPVYKPGGKLFDQCAAGNLLLLAPIAWPYVPGEKPPTRESSQVLNRIAQLIAGDGAAEIDYKGAVLSGIDEAVYSAVHGREPNCPAGCNGTGGMRAGAVHGREPNCPAGCNGTGGMLAGAVHGREPNCAAGDHGLDGMRPGAVHGREPNCPAGCNGTGGMQAGAVHGREPNCVAGGSSQGSARGGVPPRCKI